MESSPDPAPNPAGPSQPELPATLPLLPLRGVVFYPLMWLPITVGQPRSRRILEDLSTRRQRFLALSASIDPSQEEPGPDGIHVIGVIARIERLMRQPDGNLRVILQGVERMHIDRFVAVEPYLQVAFTPLPDQIAGDAAEQALGRAAQDLFASLVAHSPQLPNQLDSAVRNVADARQLVYLIAASSNLQLNDAQQLLEADPLAEKLKLLNTILRGEVEAREIAQKIQQDAQGEMQKVQREFYLRKQMEAIQKELGEQDPQAAEIAEMEERIAAARMSAEAEKEARREMERMRRMPVQAAEYSLIKTYLDWLVTLPWQAQTDDNLDVGHARQVLDEDHYGLDDIKDRIVEFLAVRKLRQERKQEREAEAVVDLIRREREGVILCFVGPPGVGKTSLGLSIARALNRKFVRLALGGIRDEAEIRGFRRTYVGSMPGRVIQSLRRVEARNPVFMLDEVDKLGRDFRGDPASALLEVLDPEQNREFRDHYLDVPFDLSQVFFITTANWLDPIPGPLRDRMEIIQLSSYTDFEKVQIALRHLVPRQVRENGLRDEEIGFDDQALLKIIHEYTQEAGVRNFERQIGAACRKVATKVAAGANGRVQVTAATVGDWLGKAKVVDEQHERVETPGIATGLAWTPVGGQVLYVEATAMPGKGRLTLTGQLGNVMKESAMAAVSLVRSAASRYGVPVKWFEEHDLHIHVPSGAQPKDGPSAGIAIASAILSLVTGRPLAEDLAMTGEITLRGRVTRIGGVREKVLAAHRHGLRIVILPEGNQNDADEVPAEVRQTLTMHFVRTIDDAWALALCPQVVQLPPPGLEAGPNGDGPAPDFITPEAEEEG
ncbi:MAG: endopeptidase La [Caldilineales bacterium]|nr:endopeptidase La [Caldilineales bacterium]MCW5860508.1 endopeptidase La [Caldilineales bacterium]